MQNLIKPLICGLFCLGLINGCGVLHHPHLHRPPQPIISWSARQAQLSQLASSHWQAQGSILVHYHHHTGLGRFNWQNRQKRYDIQIRGPLGIGSVHIAGKPGEVRLYDGHRQTATTTSAEQLMLSQLGWSVPITSLRYWLLGLPDLKRPFQAQWDNANHLIQLKQSGWLIQFDRFSSVNSIDLPGRLILKHPILYKADDKNAIMIKLSIHHWILFPIY